MPTSIYSLFCLAVVYFSTIIGDGEEVEILEEMISLPVRKLRYV